MVWNIVLLIGAYLIGSFPYMMLLSRAKGYDLSQEPDYHIAMYRKVGRWEGFSGIFLDFVKGIIPVVIGFYLNFELIFVASACVLVVVGQMWPVFQRFNGGKGNTTGLGAVATLTIAYGAGWVLFACIMVMLVGFLIRTLPRFIRARSWNEKLSFNGPVSNSFPLGMIIGFGVMPVVSDALMEPLAITLALLIVFICIVVRRLTAGVREDVKKKKSSVTRILFNRLLFDRGFYRAQE